MDLRRAKSQPLWLAHVLHRVSGLGLALFLPAHFWLLSLAMTDAARLDGFLKLADNPLIKLAEWGLVFLLAVHFFGGLRLMALEHLSCTTRQKTFAATAVALAFALATLFLLRAF